MKWPFPENTKSDANQAEWLARRLGDAPTVTESRTTSGTSDEFQPTARDAAMTVRLGTWRGTSEQLDAWMEQIESAKIRIEKTAGVLAAYWLVDRLTGTAQTITVWDSESSMLASEARYTPPAGLSAEEVRGAVLMEHYEVVSLLASSADR